MLQPDEEDELFGDSGNYTDYWLGDRQTNTFISDDVGWISLEVLLRAQRFRETRDWSPESDAIEAAMGSDFERGGGLMGGTPELVRVRAGLVGLGRQAASWESRIKT